MGKFLQLLKKKDKPIVITEIQDNITQKIIDFKKLDQLHKALAIKNDPSLFAYAILRDPLHPTKPLRVYAWQDMWLNDKSKKKLLVKARQIGASIAICIDIIYKIVFANRDKTLLVFSKGEKQAQDILYKLKLLMRNANMGFKRTLKTDSKSELYRTNKNGSECRVISEVATTSALGHSPDDVYLDEFQYTENAQDFYEHIVLPMLSKTKGSTNITSSPRDTRGYFHHLYITLNSFTKYHFDYRACPDFTDEWAAERKEEMDIINYRSEVLAEFVSGVANQFYPAELVDSLDPNVDKTYDPSKTYYIGVDWGKMSSSNVITLISHIKIDEVTNDVEVIDIITAPQGTRYSAVEGEVKALNDKYHVARVFCDRGAGEGQIDNLHEKLGINVEGVAFTIQSKIDMNTNLKKLMEKKEIKILEHKQLRNELKEFEYTFTSTGQMKLHGKPDDHVDSLALACMGVTQFKPATITLIPKKSILDGSLSPEQQDLKSNQPSTIEQFCEKCAAEGVYDCYFEMNKEDYDPKKKYYCPNHQN